MFALGTTGGANISSLLDSAQSEIMSQIGSALPAAGAVFAVIAGIGVGIKLFKRVTGTRT